MAVEGDESADISGKRQQNILSGAGVSTERSFTRHYQTFGDQQDSTIMKLSSSWRTEAFYCKGDV